MSVRKQIKIIENKLKDLLFKNFTSEKEVTEDFIKKVSVVIKEEILKNENELIKTIFTTNEEIDIFINEIIEETKKNLGLFDLKKELKLPLENIVVGQLVRWKADRCFKTWDCPGIITKVDLEKETFDVKTFDTFKETKDISFYVLDEKSEFSLCNKPIVINYLVIQNAEFLKKKADLELELYIVNTEIAERSSYVLTLRDEE